MGNLRVKTRIIGLTLMREIISAIIIKDCVLYLINFKSLFGSQSIVSITTYRSILKLYHLLSFQSLFSNDTGVIIYLLLMLCLAVSLFLGIRNAETGIGLFFMLMFLKFRAIYILDGGDNVIEVMLPLISVGVSRPILSIKQLISWGQNISHKYPILEDIKHSLSIIVPIAIMVQVSIIYFFAGILKLQGPLWINGTALHYVLLVEDFRWTAVNFYVAKSHFIVKTLTFITVIWELTFPLFLLTKATRLFIVFFSLIVHLSIFFLMHIDNYSFVMVGSLMVFISDENYHEIHRILFTCIEALKNIKKYV